MACCSCVVIWLYAVLAVILYGYLQAAGAAGQVLVASVTRTNAYEDRTCVLNARALTYTCMVTTRTVTEPSLPTIWPRGPPANNKWLNRE